jgi:SAM-dependent methyltransferase
MPDTRKVSVEEAMREDLEAIRAARRFGTWMFSQFAADVRGDVAEVGAGIGTFSDRLLSRGIRSLLMMEPDPQSAEALAPIAARDPRARVVRDSLPDARSLEPKGFDFVLCLNVLEHIEDDAAALATIRAALRPGGDLGLLVPAHPRLFGPLDERYGHYRRYTPDRLRAVLRDADLDVRELRRFNMLGIPGWWLKNRRPDARLDRRSLLLYDGLVPIWRRVERAVGPPAGLSLLVRARRSPLTSSAPASRSAD